MVGTKKVSAPTTRATAWLLASRTLRNTKAVYDQDNDLNDPRSVRAHDIADCSTPLNLQWAEPGGVGTNQSKYRPEGEDSGSRS